MEGGGGGGLVIEAEKGRWKKSTHYEKLQVHPQVKFCSRFEMLLYVSLDSYGHQPLKWYGA